ncbi:hypothetical protein BFN01_13665 [Microbacterium sp. AR7-10]|nr:hypothetical protein BFN01_13665 [Microbacterium sp. AR7-10]
MGGLCGLAGLNELLDDNRTELLGLPLGGFALGWDGQAFFEAVTGGLVLGGDPQIGDRRDQPVQWLLAGRDRLPGCSCGEGSQRCEVKAGG